MIPRLARECELPHIGGPHGLRQSLASALDANGNGLATISALLGHATTAVTSKVHTHMRKDGDAPDHQVGGVIVRVAACAARILQFRCGGG